jgi:hypothetical protein
MMTKEESEAKYIVAEAMEIQGNVEDARLLIEDCAVPVEIMKLVNEILEKMEEE